VGIIIAIASWATDAADRVTRWRQVIVCVRRVRRPTGYGGGWLLVVGVMVRVKVARNRVFYNKLG